MYKHAGFTMVVANELLGQNRKENYGFYILVYHVDFISRGAAVHGALGIKKEKRSSELQASSDKRLTDSNK